MAKKSVSFFTIINQNNNEGNDAGEQSATTGDTAESIPYLPINKPSLMVTASPLELSYGTCTINGSGFSTDITFDGKHTSTDWLVSNVSDSNFTNPIDFSYDDSENLLSYIPKGLMVGTRYWIKCRYRSGSSVSEWSDPVTYLNNGLIDLVHGGMVVQTVEQNETIKLHKRPYVRVNKSVIDGSSGSGTLNQLGFIIEVLDNDLNIIYKDFIDVANGPGGCYIPSDYLKAGQSYFIRSFTKWSIENNDEIIIKYSETTFEYLEVASFAYNNKTWNPSATIPDIDTINSNQGISGGIVDDNLFYILSPTALTSAKPGDTSWSSVDTPSGDLSGAASSLLPDNSVLTTGGQNESLRNKVYLFNYDFALPNRWEMAVELASLNQPRHAHAQITLSNGKVMVVGGIHDSSTVNPQESEIVEIYDPDKNIWTTMNRCPLRKTNGQLINLPNGKVLYLSGNNNPGQYEDTVSCGVYDYRTDSWEIVTRFPTRQLDDNDSYFGLVRGILDLTDVVFIYGGKNSLNNETNDIKLYNNLLNSWMISNPGPISASEVVLAASYSEGMVLLTNTPEQNNTVYSFK